ncbi:hypothetical protein GCM10009692_11110 [Leucobacter aridicollis]
MQVIPDRDGVDQTRIKPAIRLELDATIRALLVRGPTFETAASVRDVAGAARLMPVLRRADLPRLGR